MDVINRKTSFWEKGKISYANDDFNKIKTWKCFRKIDAV